MEKTDDSVELTSMELSDLSLLQQQPGPEKPLWWMSSEDESSFAGMQDKPASGAQKSQNSWLKSEPVTTDSMNDKMEEDKDEKVSMSISRVWRACSLNVGSRCLSACR